MAFLTEAADDICYIIADLEDGHSLRRIRTQETIELLNSIAHVSPNNLKDLNPKRQVAYLRAMSINALISDTYKIFMDNEKGMLAGKFGRDGATLLGQTLHYPTLKEIKTQTRKFVFNSDVVLPVEIAGYETISGLFEAFGNMLHSYHENAKEVGGREKKLLLYCDIDLSILDNKYLSLLTFTDYVSGMTDSYAIRQYQIFKGIRYR